MDSMNIGQTLKNLREERGLSQAELAVQTGMSQPVIGKIEANIAPISKNAALKLAAFFGVELSTFLPPIDGPQSTEQPQKIKLTPGAEEEIIKIVMETVDEFLNENGLEMSIDGKAKIFAHLLRAACKEPTIIKGILSGMLLANSEVFSKKDR